MAKTIWAVLQHRDGELSRISLETLVAAQQLAQLVEGEVEAVLLGADVAELAQRAAAQMAVSRLWVADHPALATYTPGPYITVLAAAIRDATPAFVLFPHTYQSMDYFPRLAHDVGGALLPTVGAFRLVAGKLVWTRPVLGGKLQADTRVKGDGPVLASIQAGSFALDRLQRGTSPVQPLPVDLGGIPADREVLGVEQAAAEEVDLSKAEVVVAVGRGIGGADKMGVVEELAAALGAEIGASRPVIDNGWLPRDRQIGSSGQTVAPRLYVAVGISGAIQHLVGMKASGVVVAINKDRSAPIFSVADYGIVGDLHEVLPALTAAIREAKGR
ncbi:MAG TPA: electron transfer flavoprotein subunit alpha/FixB family protein [Thermoanaerobaculia bacterium]|nr:electron transfer flavoprotein subunit alpha/FixB family protein [Thermoanaerobaculia bacterium]